MPRKGRYFGVIFGKEERNRQMKMSGNITQERHLALPEIVGEQRDVRREQDIPFGEVDPSKHFG